jgi:hypothetical protein
MQFNKIHDVDFDQFVSEYPAAHSFLCRRAHRNEWFDLANIIYSGHELTAWEDNRFTELTRLHAYDLDDIPTLTAVNQIKPGLVDSYPVKNY